MAFSKKEARCQFSITSMQLNFKRYNFIGIKFQDRNNNKYNTGKCSFVFLVHYVALFISSM